MIDVSWKRMLLLLLVLVVKVVVQLLLLLLLQLLWMRLHRRRRLLNYDRRFADRLLFLLLVGFYFNRWRIGVGRDDRCSAGGGHFRYRNRRNHRMMRRRRKMWWWRIDGLQRTTSPGIDGHFVWWGLLLPCRRSAHVEHLSLSGMHVGWWWRMIRRWMLQMRRRLMMYQHATR